MPGWIKIHRQIQNCLIWDDKPFNMASAWIDLLLLANHEDKETIFDKKPILIKRGQRITSVRELSARWGWGKDKTLRFLRLLEREKMIVKESDSRRTLLTIVNYGKYQDMRSTERNTNGARTERKPEHKRSETKNEERMNKRMKKEESLPTGEETDWFDEMEDDNATSES